MADQHESIRKCHHHQARQVLKREHLVFRSMTSYVGLASSMGERHDLLCLLSMDLLGAQSKRDRLEQ